MPLRQPLFLRIPSRPSNDPIVVLVVNPTCVYSIIMCDCKIPSVRDEFHCKLDSTFWKETSDVKIRNSISLYTMRFEQYLVNISERMGMEDGEGLANCLSRFGIHVDALYANLPSKTVRVFSKLRIATSFEIMTRCCSAKDSTGGTWANSLRHGTRFVSPIAWCS